jgi:molybdenum cofactor cytidylyltransferase
MLPDTGHTAILLLAAGASERLGQPKQLLEIGDQTLLEKMAKVALSARLGPVTVVLGAFFEKTAAALHGLDVEVVKNEDWANGMGSSIACGTRHIQMCHPEAEALLIMLCDQPFVTPEVLNQINEIRKKDGALIVASSYGEAVGPPILFDRQLFGELAALRGQKGAKAVIQNHSGSISEVAFPKGAVDIDTEKDYEKLKGYSDNDGI